ncbi:MAG: sulfite exporter TauE/SafE family protein [Deltaproteobacteria bacterium]|nr:sulfite exporter TauE/SafE family protein [Deltaproteobacteria bacterium]
MIRAIAASPLGFLVGLSLGALGSGGSILAVPALVYAAGQTPQQATATSLLLVGVAALSGLPAHLRAGRVKVAHGIAFGATGIGGSLAGTAANRRLDPDMLLLAFSGLIMIAAWRMLTACPTCTRSGEQIALEEISAARPRASIDLGRGLMVIATGTAVGFLTGLFGVGGGFVIVPALTLTLGLAMPQAIGTSLLVVAINSAMALAARLGTAAPIDWIVAGVFTVAAVAGVLAGGRIADRIDARRSLRAFAAGLVLLALMTAAGAIAAMI